MAYSAGDPGDCGLDGVHDSAFAARVLQKVWTFLANDRCLNITMTG